jgi:FAD-linked oxidoreductase
VAPPATVWRNWAGDQQCVPAAVEHPASVDELRASIARAVDGARSVRVSASGHSFTDIACTDGVMVRLDRMDRVLEIDPAAGLAKVQGGTVIRDLSEALAGHGLALENLGDIDVQTVAGAISTATHGTGERFGNISAQVEALELVTADGSVVECSRESDPELWRAARVGLGSLGAIATVTFRVVPSFTIRRHDHPLPLEEAFARLDELAAANEHFEFYVFPHTRTALCRESRHTNGPPEPYGRLREYLQETVLENHALGALCRVGKRAPGRIPAINRFITRTLSGSVKTDASHRVFSTRRLVRFTEMEYAIPREHGPEALTRVLEMIDRRGYAVPFPIEFRIVAGDDAYLSTAHERETVYIAVHMYRGMTWEPYFRAVEAIMDDYEGRPHWGKRHFQSAATLAPRYPEWDRFQAVRARLDPEGRFQNEYSRRVLGPVGAEVATSA